MRTIDFKLYRIAMTEAMASVDKEFGIKSRMTNILIDGASFTAKVECEHLDEDAKQSIENKFRRYADLMGYDPNWFGVVIKEKNKEYKIIGVNSNKPKNCLKIEQVDTGTIYSAPVGWAKRYIK